MWLGLVVVGKKNGKLTESRVPRDAHLPHLQVAHVIGDDQTQVRVDARLDIFLLVLGAELGNVYALAELRVPGARNAALLRAAAALLLAVRGQVLLQNALAPEGLVAAGALVLLVAGVRDHVVAQLPEGFEGLFADYALIGPFARVDADVRFEVSFFIEGLGAVLALEGFDAVVRPQVH